MALPSLDESQMKLVQDLEVEMMTDMYSRLSNACHKKCIPTKYKDAEVGKGEAVCIDRKLQAMAQQLELWQTRSQTLAVMISSLHSVLGQ